MLTPTAFGGAEKVGLQILRSIDRKRFNVIPITLIRPWEAHNAFIDSARAAGYQCHAIPVALKPRNQGHDIFRVVRCLTRCRALLKCLRINLVHTNGYFADLIGIPAARSLKLRSIATCHGFIEGDRKLRLYNLADKKILRFADRTAAVSANIRDALIASGVSSKRIEVIANAVEMQPEDEKISEGRAILRKRFHIRDQDIVLGYAGRMSEEKGLLYLIEAAGVLLKGGIPVKLLMVGDGPQRGVLEKAAVKIGIQSEVIFTGFQLQAETFLKAMDIFVLPSLTEGTPMAMLEAMSGGVPVIASAVGGVPDIICSDQNGILVEPARPQQIVQAVKVLHRNRIRSQAIINEARRTIEERFSIIAWIKRYEALYSSLLPWKAERSRHAFCSPE